MKKTSILAAALGLIGLSTGDQTVAKKFPANPDRRPRFAYSISPRQHLTHDHAGNAVMVPMIRQQIIPRSKYPKAA